MAGWFTSSGDSKPDPQAAAAIEQQIEMMDRVFMQYYHFHSIYKRSCLFIKGQSNNAGGTASPQPTRREN